MPDVLGPQLIDPNAEAQKKANEELGFSPKINIDEGLKKTLEWFSSQEFKNENTRF